MSSRFKGKLCLHLRAKELTIFRDSFIWQLAVWAWAWAGVAVGSGPLGAVTRCPRRRQPFHFFFRDLAFFGDSERSGFAGHDDVRTDDDETGLPPLNPLVLRTENRQFYRHFLAIKTIFSVFAGGLRAYF